jgi:hypothetical protein
MSAKLSQTWTPPAVPGSLHYTWHEDRETLVEVSVPITLDDEVYLAKAAFREAASIIVENESFVRPARGNYRTGSYYSSLEDLTVEEKYALVVGLTNFVAEER